MENNEPNNGQPEAESKPPVNGAEGKAEEASADILEKEKLIDPGNEHHHSDGETKQKSDTNIDTHSINNEDTGGDGTGTAGPEPGEGRNDAPDTSGEDG